MYSGESQEAHIHIRRAAVPGEICSFGQFFSSVYGGYNIGYETWGPVGEAKTVPSHIDIVRFNAQYKNSRVELQYKNIN